MYCSSCGAQAPDGARFCPACSTALSVGSASSFDAPTELAPSSASAAASPPPTGGADDEARFLPGATIGGRYRIAGLLGRGGMGEVYRADDLKLGQPVALKFLPEAMAAEPEWLERFLTEVKIARQVSHPNVCRVYDVGEIDGHHYLSMEYIDGEDLASLLRRIGRLPQDKAIQIARQICAGLAASHDRGVLHRDLKPANVMIDGRGNAHLTDFGLAGLAEAMTEADAYSGTPAFMAPEQLAGREVTARSDLYALGLVLYQLFTGKRAYDAKSVRELTELQQESAPTHPSLHVDGLDAAVERVILRCLEREPADRPASALAVSAALPGGDPLAAALAAGETPSPEMVAAAGEKGVLSPTLAGILFAGFLALLIGFVSLASRYETTSAIPMDRPRDVLIDRARETLANLGVPQEELEHSAFGFSYDRDAQRYLGSESKAPDPWRLLGEGRPAVLHFWYRAGRDPLRPRNVGGQVFWTDPAPTQSGMAGVRLDTSGRLLELTRVPGQTHGAGAASRPDPDWGPAFAAAGLDREAFAPTEPLWLPPTFADARSAWTGEIPELPGVELRVEAASFGGRPVYFRLVGPWSRAERQTALASSVGSRINQVVGLTLFVAILALALWTARRNLRAGRGDRRGATRLAFLVLGAFVSVWLLRGQHTATPGDELTRLFLATGNALLQAALTWCLYIALEPFVRRHYPEWIIGWSRLLAGRFRDPLVGRDLLIGAVGGAGVAFLALVVPPLRHLAGHAGTFTQDVWLQPLYGLRWAVASLVGLVPNAVFSAMVVISMWFLLCRLLRLRWLAGVALVAVLTLSFSAGGGFSWVDLSVSALIAGIFLLLLLRHGLLAQMSLIFFAVGLSNLPISFDASAWYVRNSWLALAVFVALAAYAFRASLGGRRLFGDELDGAPSGAESSA